METSVTGRALRDGPRLSVLLSVLGAILFGSGLGRAESIEPTSEERAPAVFVDVVGAELSVKAMSAPLDRVLKKIGETSGFAVEVRCPKDICPKFSGEKTGSVKQLIAWLLEKDTYLIVHSDDPSQKKIDRLVALVDIQKHSDVVAGKVSDQEDLVGDPQKPRSKKGFYVQLASYLSLGRAKAAWKMILKTNRDLLEGLDPDVKKATPGGDKKTYFRLRAGPLPSLEAARSLCKRLKEQNTKTQCLPVSP